MSDNKALVKDEPADPASATGDSEGAMALDTSAENEEMIIIDDIQSPESKGLPAATNKTEASADPLNINAPFNDTAVSSSMQIRISAPSKLTTHIGIKGPWSLYINNPVATVHFTLDKVADLLHLKKCIQTSSKFQTIELDGVICVTVHFNTYHFKDEIEGLRMMNLRNFTCRVPVIRSVRVRLNNVPKTTETELLEMLFPKARTITISKQKGNAMLHFNDLADAERCLIENQDLVIEKKQLTMDILDWKNNGQVLMTNDTAPRVNPPIKQGVFESLQQRMSRISYSDFSYDRVKAFSLEIAQQISKHDVQPKGQHQRIEKMPYSQQSQVKREMPSAAQKQPVVSPQPKPFKKPNVVHDVKKNQKVPAMKKAQGAVKRNEPPKSRQTLWDKPPSDRQAVKRSLTDRVSGQPDRKKAKTDPKPDWFCPRSQCRFKNFSYRMYCKKCKCQRPDAPEPRAREGGRERRNSEPTRPARDVTGTERIAIKVPANQVSQIIGARGEVRAVIQDESHCSLIFPDLDEPGLDVKTCVITGSPKMLSIARKMVEHAIGTTMSIVEVNLTIPRPAVPKVVGKQSLPWISGDFNITCTMMGARSADDEPTLKLSGYYDKVEKAHDVILEYMYQVMNNQSIDDTLRDYVQRMRKETRPEPHTMTQPQKSLNDDELRERITAKILERVSKQVAVQQEMGLPVPHYDDIQKQVMEEVTIQMAEVRRQEAMSIGKDLHLENRERRPSMFEPDHREAQVRTVHVEERDRQLQEADKRLHFEEHARQQQQLTHYERAKIDKAKQEEVVREKLEKERREQERREQERREQERREQQRREQQRREQEKREQEERKRWEELQRFEREEREKREMEEQRRSTDYREQHEKMLIDQAHAKMEREKQLIQQEREKLVQERRALERQRLTEEVEKQQRMLSEEQKLMKERKMLEDAKRELEEKQARLEKSRLDQDRRAVFAKNPKMWKPVAERPLSPPQYQDYQQNQSTGPPTSYPNMPYNVAAAPPMQAAPLPVPPRMPYGVGMRGSAPYSNPAPYQPQQMSGSAGMYNVPPLQRETAPYAGGQMHAYSNKSTPTRYPPPHMTQPSAYATGPAGMGSGRGQGMTSASTELASDMQKLVSDRVAKALTGHTQAADSRHASDTANIDIAEIIARARRLRAEELEAEQRNPERWPSSERRGSERRWSPERSSRRPPPQRGQQSRKGNRKYEDTLQQRAAEYASQSQDSADVEPAPVTMTGINDLIMNIMSNPT